MWRSRPDGEDGIAQRAHTCPDAIVPAGHASEDDNVTIILWVTSVMLVVALASGLALVVARRRSRATDSEDLDFWASLDHELERARRYEHPVALVRLTTSEPQGFGADDIVRLRSFLRSSDRMSVTSHDAIVLAPETDSAGATHLVGRLRDGLGGFATTTRVAGFPEDALTRHALVRSITGEPPRRPVRPASHLGARRAM